MVINLMPLKSEIKFYGSHPQLIINIMNLNYLKG